MSEELAQFTITEAAQLVEKGEASPLELVDSTLERIERLEPKLNAFITVMADQARRDARRLTAELARGRRRGPLHGIPLSLKDLYYTKGVRTTAGSKVLADFIPEYDATTTAKLKRAGAIIVGKNNLHEFAPGSTNNNAHYGPCYNPWMHGRIPGGSSGGSGAAVSASMTMGTMGTDTAGSIRIPSCMCSLVGMKATYGRVSRYGVVPLSWSLDHAGPMTRTVEDNVIMLQALAGYDSKDASSLRVPVPDYSQGMDAGVRGLKIGLPREIWDMEFDSEIAGLVRRAVGVLEELGADVRELSLPLAEASSYAANLISRAESTSIHEEWLVEHGEDYGDNVRGRLQMGAAVTAVDYIKAQRVKTLVQREFGRVLEEVDVLATPTCPIPAHGIDEDPTVPAGRPFEGQGMMTLYTRPFDVSGQPAITVPCGFTAEGLPAGMQLVGPWLGEGLLFRAANAYEKATEWHLRRPPV